MSSARFTLSIVSFLAAFLALSGTGRAESLPLNAEVATGVLILGDGPSFLEAGLSLDLGLSVVLARYCLVRAGLGFVTAVDRHGPEFYARPRLEAGGRLEIGRWRPGLGAGVFTLGRSPAVYALAGLGFQMSPAWQLALDVRSGVFWDQRGARDGRTRFGEAQLLVSWSLPE